MKEPITLGEFRLSDIQELSESSTALQFAPVKGKSGPLDAMKFYKGDARECWVVVPDEVAEKLRPELAKKLQKRKVYVLNLEEKGWI